MTTSLTLYRTIMHEDYTIGVLLLRHEGDTYQWTTCERPWLDNQRRISCIPMGSYDVFLDVSRKNGLKEHGYKVVELKGVLQRSQIQFHVGNSPRDSAGCILIAKSFNNDLQSKIKVTTSRIAYKEFFRLTSPLIEEEKLTSFEVIEI